MWQVPPNVSVVHAHGPIQIRLEGTNRHSHETHDNRTLKPLKMDQKDKKNLTVATINTNRIKIRTNSIESLTKAAKFQIASISESKITKTKNKKVYKWIGRNRKNKEEKLEYFSATKQLIWRNCGNHMDNTRMHTKEYKHCNVLWPTEKWKTWKGERLIYDKLENQIKQKGKNNKIIGGGFNIKLAIERDSAQQEESRNGKIMQEMIENNILEPTTLKAEKCIWTRYEWNNKEKNQQ